MKKKLKYGFLGTSGLLIMILSGTFITAMSLYIVIKFMNGMESAQSIPFCGYLFLGGILPYGAGTLFFLWGKKIAIKNQNQRKF